jgi:hypothetical protein
MAQRVVTELLDDFDDSTAEETVTFGYRGQQYEIDLNAQHATELDEALAPYLEHARKGISPGLVPRQGRRAQRGSRTHRDTRAIRAWAKEQGIAISDRGRIPAEIMERYQRRWLVQLVTCR